MLIYVNLHITSSHQGKCNSIVKVTKDNNPICIQSASKRKMKFAHFGTLTCCTFKWMDGCPVISFWSSKVQICTQNEQEVRKYYKAIDPEQLHRLHNTCTVQKYFTVSFISLFIKFSVKTRHH